MLVSIVIPCYNVEHYIAQCIQSILNQKHKDLQIICVNNHSTDNTLSVLTRFAIEHSSLITLVEEPQKGAPYARNRGLLEVSGTYVQFLDADDLLEPDKIAHQVALIEAHNFPEIVAGDYFRQAVDGSKKLHQVNHQDYWLGLLYTQLGITSANLFKTSAVKDVNGFDVTLKSSQEYALMYNMMRNGAQVIHDKTALTIIRDRASGSISQQHASENMERYLDLRISIVKHLEEKTDTASLQRYYQALFDAIRVFYKHNPSSALRAFKTHIPAKFKPQPSAATTQGYILLFNLFGFERSEKIKSLLK